MKVKQLVTALSGLHPETEVLVHVAESAFGEPGWGEIERVEVRQDVDEETFAALIVPDIVDGEEVALLDVVGLDTPEAS